jgi:hypothetical protein
MESTHDQDGGQVRSQGRGHIGSGKTCDGIPITRYIPSVVVAPDVDEATTELIEIDEKLMRAELTRAQRADHIARRQEIFERIRGPAKARGAHADNAAMCHNANDNWRMRSRVRPPRRPAGQHVPFNDGQRGKATGSENLNKIANTSLDKGNELDAVAKLDTDQKTLSSAQQQARR